MMKNLGFNPKKPVSVQVISARTVRFEQNKTTHYVFENIPKKIAPNDTQ